MLFREVLCPKGFSAGEKYSFVKMSGKSFKKWGLWAEIAWFEPFQSRFSQC